MKGLEINEFIRTKDKTFDLKPGLDDIFKSLIEASTDIANMVNRAGLLDIYGKTDKENIQGEEVMKLDEISNNILIEKLRASRYCAGVASEELDEFISFENREGDSLYVVLFDPLDGSSNIDTNAPIGTIFNIYKKKSPSGLDLNDFLQSGREVVAAGYVIYGSSAILVYSAGNGVQGFTLDRGNAFRLSHPNISTPSTANQFSINYGNHLSFSSQVTSFVNWCTIEDKASKRPYSLRYIGSMVGDFHRNLIKGGIFIYPRTEKAPKGKLRLMYECIPLSYIQEQAGGLSSNDEMSILDIIPEELHQRTPISIGSKELMNQYLSGG